MLSPEGRVFGRPGNWQALNRGAGRHNGFDDRNGRGQLLARKTGPDAFVLEDGVVYHTYSS